MTDTPDDDRQTMRTEKLERVPSDVDRGCWRLRSAPTERALAQRRDTWRLGALSRTAITTAPGLGLSLSCIAQDALYEIQHRKMRVAWILLRQRQTRDIGRPRIPRAVSMTRSTRTNRAHRSIRRLRGRRCSSVGVVLMLYRSYPTSSRSVG